MLNDYFEQMKFSERIMNTLREVLPSPFSLAVILTVLTFILALFLTSPNPEIAQPHAFQLFGYWYGGLWKLLEFAMQMMVMLVLGHVLALSKPFNWLMDKAVLPCTSGPLAAFWVTLIAVCFALFNWGLGLIIGALFARKVAEHAQKKMIPINFPLIGACGYAGLMVWHGGLSGSAPLKVAQQKHMFAHLTNGEAISISETILSPMNLAAIIACLVILPLAMSLLARSLPSAVPNIKPRKTNSAKNVQKIGLAEKLDFSPIFAKIFGSFLLFGFLYVFWIEPGKLDISKIDPNLINLFFLSLALLFHRNIREFLSATEEAILGSTGIMLQFPLYAGIMGIMAGSGLITVFSEMMVEISGPESFFIFTLISASVVNFFVPSGGGQWVIQGEIVLTASNSLGVPQPKAVMALAYGDQLTNMMQPFWALPLLAITGLRAGQIMPYTLFLMLLGSLIFSSVLMIF